MYQVRSQYFHPAFERLFSDAPFSRSFEHKVRISLCVRRETKKKKKKKKKWKTRDALHKCSMLRIALKRGKLATRYINAMLRTALTTYDIHISAMNRNG
jgi:hypothetical protein